MLVILPVLADLPLAVVGDQSERWRPTGVRDLVPLGDALRRGIGRPISGQVDAESDPPFLALRSRRARYGFTDLRSLAARHDSIVSIELETRGVLAAPGRACHGRGGLVTAPLPQVAGWCRARERAIGLALPVEDPDQHRPLPSQDAETPGGRLVPARSGHPQQDDDLGRRHAADLDEGGFLGRGPALDREPVANAVGADVARRVGGLCGIEQHDVLTAGRGQLGSDDDIAAAVGSPVGVDRNHRLLHIENPRPGDQLPGRRHLEAGVGQP